MSSLKPTFIDIVGVLYLAGLFFATFISTRGAISPQDFFAQAALVFTALGLYRANGPNNPPA